MGMSSEEFWHGRPRLCEAYRQAHAIRREAAYYDEWRAGLYTFEALAAAAPLYRGRVRGEEPRGYPERPLFSKESQRLREEDEERRHMERMRANVLAFATSFNKRFEQDGN